MKQVMSRAEIRRVNRVANKRGADSKEAINEIVDSVQGKIVQAVKEVDLVALLYVLNERIDMSQEQVQTVYDEFNKAIDDFNNGVLDYPSIKSMYYEED